MGAQLASMTDRDMGEVLKDAFQCAEDERDLMDMLFGNAAATAAAAAVTPVPAHAARGNQAAAAPQGSGAARQEGSHMLRTLLENRERSPFVGLPATFIAGASAANASPSEGAQQSSLHLQAELLHQHMQLLQQRQQERGAAAQPAAAPPGQAEAAAGGSSPIEAERQQSGASEPDSEPPKRGRGRPPKADGNYSQAYLTRKWGLAVFVSKKHFPSTTAHSRATLPSLKLETLTIGPPPSPRASSAQSRRTASARRTS